MQQVRTENDRGTFAGAGGDRHLHATDADRIESGERFIQQQRRGLMQETAGDRQLLLHAAGEFGGQGILFRGELELFEQHGDARARLVHAIQAGDELQVFGDREIVEQLRFIGDKREP